MHGVAAVSAENGVEGFVLFDKSINCEKYLTVFDQVDTHGKDYCICGDNVNYHVSKHCIEAYKQRGVESIASVDWIPELNPCEGFFGLLKAEYR